MLEVIDYEGSRLNNTEDGINEIFNEDPFDKIIK